MSELLAHYGDDFISFGKCIQTDRLPPNLKPYKVTYLLVLPTWDSCRRLEVPDCLRSVHDKLAVRVAPLYTDFSRLGVSLLQHEYLLVPFVKSQPVPCYPAPT